MLFDLLRHNRLFCERRKRHWHSAKIFYIDTLQADSLLFAFHPAL